MPAAGERLHHAAEQPTRVLVVSGGEVFSNGVHLNVIHAPTTPAVEGWRNIVAIDDVTREMITCTNQLLVTSVGGNAGAGGVMLALGADHVLARDGVVLNPHYLTMGLHGSEYWTYTLPRRVGPDEAARLTEQCLPIGASGAARLGLADAVLPGSHAPFDDAVLDYAHSLAGRDDYARLLEAKRSARGADERRKPLEAYRSEELGEMSRDLFEDRHGYAAARHAFVTKQKPTSTPPHLALHRSAVATLAYPDVARRGELTRSTRAAETARERPASSRSGFRLSRAPGRAR